MGCGYTRHCAPSDAQGSEPSSGASPAAAGASARDQQVVLISPKALRLVGLLGTGHAGHVELREDAGTGRTYALKVVSKGRIQKTGMVDAIRRERDILNLLESPFIVKMFQTYRCHQNLYFLMEVALGGHLHVAYNKHGFYGSPCHCQFYAAAASLALAHMHGRGVIHRQTTPENLLLDAYGRAKLINMDVAKLAEGRQTFTLCGTPDYFAPEMIGAQGHGSAVDWWSLGILIFELMSGRLPFDASTPQQMLARIMKGIQSVPFPSECPANVKDLIKALLRKNPNQRLPMRAGGMKNLMEHKWYQSFEWDAMIALTLEPPYRPKVCSNKDLGNFAAKQEKKPSVITFKDDGTGWDDDFGPVMSASVSI